MYAMLVFSYSSLVPKPALWRTALALLAAAGLSACGSFNNATTSIASVVTPFKVEVVQGNFISKEQVDALQPGMSRSQVRDILGAPFVASTFHADRWDYVFTIRRQGIQSQSRKLTVYFKGDDLLKFEGDTMPSEAEFIASLDTNRKLGKVPNLEASPEQLDKAQGDRPAPVAAQPLPPAATSYPPLEAPKR